MKVYFIFEVEDYLGFKSIVAVGSRTLHDAIQNLILRSEYHVKTWRFIGDSCHDIFNPDVNAIMGKGGFPLCAVV